MKKAVFAADIKLFDDALEFINKELELANCNKKVLTQIDIAFEEMFVNVAHYAYQGEEGKIEINIDIANNIAEILLIDSGIYFNPLEKDDPDITLPIQERTIGGLGIFIVKNTMDSVSYENKDGKNIFRMTKNISTGF